LKIVIVAVASLPDVWHAVIVSRPALLDFPEPGLT
jgi:hypothetical protein